MKALAVLAVLFGVMALLRIPADNSVQEASHEIVATNYAIYRNAAFLFAFAHKGYSGDIPPASLALPEGWRMLRTWHARMQGGYCYVYGEASPDEVEAVRRLFRGSFAVGLADRGRLVPAGPTPVSVPSFIPNGNLASVVEVS